LNKLSSTVACTKAYCPSCNTILQLRIWSSSFKSHTRTPPPTPRPASLSLPPNPAPQPKLTSVLPSTCLCTEQWYIERKQIIAIYSMDHPILYS
jgi:hypothetical protein